jgi:biopolymer transport protein TolR
MHLKRHRPDQLICNINVAGFVGVMLALLYLFMPVNVDGHRGAPVDLPHVGHPVSMAHANREDAIVIAITRDDKLFFRDDQVALDQLPAKIQESVSRGSEKRVYIRADARAKCGWVAEILDGVHSAGVEKIGILVDE